MGYKLTILGLSTFMDVTQDGGLVLLPNGEGNGMGIADHFARLYIERARIDNADGWWAPVPDPDMTNVGVTVFPIAEPSFLTISGIEEGAREMRKQRLRENPNDNIRDEGLDASQHTLLMPSLNELDPTFRIDLQRANTIARFVIRRGILSAHRLAGCAVSLLTVPESARTGPVTITARTRSGDAKRLVVLDETDIALANISRLGAPQPEIDTPSHINIYRLLDPESMNVLPEPEIDSRLTPIPGPQHPLVVHITDNFGQVPRPGCSGLVYSSAVAELANQ